MDEAAVSTETEIQARRWVPVRAGAGVFWGVGARTKKPASEGDDPKRAFVMFGGELEVELRC